MKLEEGYSISYFRRIESLTSRASYENPVSASVCKRRIVLVTKAFVTKTIRLLQTEADTGFSYDAREVSDSIRRKYEIE